MKEYRHPDDSVSAYSGSESTLPLSVMEWAGLDRRDPLLVFKRGEVNECHRVSSFNDCGVTFDAIADLIEAQL